MLQLVFAVSLAVVVSFFCSIAEAVLYSLSWSKIEGMRSRGSRAGGMLYDLRRDVDKPITAILTLNTVAHTVGASLAGASWARVFGPDTLTWFALVFTVVVLLFSEILPKTIGVAHNVALAPLLARPMVGLVWLLTPVIWGCAFVARLAGGGKAGPDATESDIKSLASLVRKAGTIEPQEEAAIHNILALDTRTAEQIMTPRTVVFSLPVHMTVAEAMDSVPSWAHSRFPVWDRDREDVVGVVTRREVFKSQAEGRGHLRLSDMMRPAEFVPETLPLNQLLRRFLARRLHLFVVLDEYGGVSGVVTLEDVLEDIIGQEIVDETDLAADLRELARQRRRELISRAAGEGGGRE